MSSVAEPRHADTQLQLGGPGRDGRHRVKLAGLEYMQGDRRRNDAGAARGAAARIRARRGRVGRALFAMEPAEWMYNPIGSVHGGIAATILDSCMGCAVHTTLEAGVGYTTTDLQVRYIRAMSVATGRVLAEGRVVHGGKRSATAEGRLFAESDETLIAHGTTGCMILR